MSDCQHSTKGDCPHQHHHHHELVIEGLCVSYHKTPALREIELATSCGNSVALVGPNGAGKSTLLKAIAGLQRKDKGSILWRNEPIQRWSREFAYLPQSEEVNWDFPITVRGMVEMGRYPHLGPWKRYSAHDDEVVERALALMRLEPLQDRQIRELSGGQQQRAFLARSIAQEAHVLLLDEPFTGLDRDHSAQLSDLLRNITHEGRLVIASHHDLNTAADIFDHTLLINQEVIAYGPTATTLSEANLNLAFTN
ncbi:metal ABC transporter ATP-binding protein [Verrucomicrobiaceae bacterium N1E253]|uniref:Metal ABC transporter ATP-binding protein n=1 Tax=Oceaniferula marina TaxID=2748318 RepID=A0A851GCV8_9BACT|nr:metal ABC transporter ATP-binding protein [Oceaniferula marina]NWK55383.1 metal ABC transporter ATP-binding protein [Oceaniferula marina]